MSIDANDAVTSPRASTGPRTEAGKAASSRNAIKSGLFTTCDFIREGEHEEYRRTLESLLAGIGPEGALEETFTAEIVSATWRLRRCRMLEAGLAGCEDARSEEEAAIEARQKAVDRARAHSHNVLRRSLGELRKLQTDRSLHNEFDILRDAPLADCAQLMRALLMKDRILPVAPGEEPENIVTPEPAPSLSSFCKPGSFCKPAPTAAKTVPAVSGKVPRNAPCPCRSGAKYKKCCGFSTTPLQSVAA